MFFCFSIDRLLIHVDGVDEKERQQGESRSTWERGDKNKIIEERAILRWREEKRGGREHEGVRYEQRIKNERDKIGEWERMEKRREDDDQAL